MKKAEKILAVLLSVLTTLGMFSSGTAVFAASYSEAQLREAYFNENLSEYLKTIVDTEGAVAVSEIEENSETEQKFENGILTVETDKISNEEIDNNLLTLKLEDGSETSYMFSEPISFINENGKLVFKDTTITETTEEDILADGYVYENGANDYKIYFGKNSSDGVMLSSPEGAQTQIVPQSNISTNGEITNYEDDGKTITAYTYNGVYDNATSLRYTPQLNGVKEEITVNSYTGKTSYEFKLFTGGDIAAVNSYGDIEIINKETKEILDTFKAPYAYDSSEGFDETSVHYSDCKYELEKVTDGEYLLKVNVPKEYLTAETTQYPVVIDPTTSHISMTLDTSVYSAYADTTHGGNQTACFGRTGSSEYGRGRAMFYFKLPSDIKKYAKISSAKLYLRETTGRTDTMYVRPYAIKDTWNNSVTWNTKPSIYSKLSYTGKSDLSMPRRNINSTSTDISDSSYWYAFNITYAVRAWITGTISNRGIEFFAECDQNTDGYHWRAFATKENSTSSYRPYAVINYTNDTTSPTISTVSGNPTAWTKKATLKVTATDETYGVYRYSFDNGKTWQASASKTFTKNGTVYVKVKDYAGNISAAKTVKITKVDNTPPDITEVTVTPKGWTKDKVTVKVTASDSGVGLHDTPYSYNGGETWVKSNKKTVTDLDATYNIVVRDKANNQTKKDFNPNISVAQSTTDWTNGKVTLTVNAKDGKEYSFNGGAYSTQSTYTVRENGSVTIKIKLSNGTDIVTLSHDVTNIDCESPEMPDLYEENDLVYISSRSFEFDEDNESPEIIQYKIGDGAWTDYDGEPLDIVRTYSASVSARVCDGAGNNSKTTELELENSLGEYTESYTDISVGEGVFPVDFTRTYSSNGGWFFAFNANISPCTNGYVFGDFYGEKIYYIQNAENEYFNADGEKLAVTKDENGKTVSFELSYNDMTCTFDADGRISNIKTDTLNTAYTWGENTLTIDGGAIVTFDGANPVVISVIRSDADGTKYTKTVKYEWNGDNLEKFTDAENTEHSYAYTDGKLTDNNGTEILYSDGRVKCITEENGAFVKYKYNDTAKSRDAELTGNIGTLTATDSRGVTDIFYYVDGVIVNGEFNCTDNAAYAPENISNAVEADLRSNIAYVVEEKEEENNENGETGNIEETQDETSDLYDKLDDGSYLFYKYDDADRVVETLEVSAGKLDVTAETSFADAEAVADKKTVTVYEENSEYDIAEETVFIRNSNGEFENYSKTEYSYDENGRVNKYSESTGFGEGWLENYSEEYTYDVYGNVTEKIVTENELSNGVTVTKTTSKVNTFDVWNQQIKTETDTNGEKSETSLEYDNLGRTVCVTEDGKTVAYTYDNDNNVTKVIDDGKTTVYEYRNGKLVSRTTPDGNAASYVYDGFGNLKSHEFNGYSFTYNTLGSILTANSESGEIVNYVYSKTVNQDVLSSNFGNGQNVSFEYSDDGEIVAVKFADDSRYTYEYFETTDENGEVTKRWSELEDDINSLKKVLEGAKESVYDVNGEFLYSIETVYKDDEKADSFDGKVTTVGNDTYTLVTEESEDTFKTNGTTVFQKSTETDKNGNTTKTTTGTSFSTEYGYTAESTISVLSNVLKEITLEYSYGFDNNGNITGETVTKKTKGTQGETLDTTENTAYTYDENGQLKVAENGTTK